MDSMIEVTFKWSKMVEMDLYKAFNGILWISMAIMAIIDAYLEDFKADLERS